MNPYQLYIQAAFTSYESSWLFVIRPLFSVLCSLCSVLCAPHEGQEDAVRTFLMIRAAASSICCAV